MFPIEIQVYRSLIATSRKLRHKMRPLFERFGLTGSQYAVLTRIPPEGITLTQLAQVAWVDPGNTSGIVDRLVREGWAERTRSEEDRRAVKITVSDRGRRVLAELEPLYRNAVRELLSGLEPNEVAELGRLLEKLGEERP